MATRSPDASPKEPHRAGQPTTEEDAGGASAAALDIRQTPEYAAAWDLELWRAVQVAKIQKDLKEKERKAIDEMKTRVQQRERAESAQIEKRLRDCAAREAASAKAADALEKRKAKIKEAEMELRRQLDETDEFRKRLDVECDARVARVKEEVSHRLELQHQRLGEAQEQIKRADDRAATAQKEYLKLWEEFSDYKTRLLAQSGPQIAHQLDAMRAQNESNILMVSERYDRRMQEATRQAHEERKAVSDELHKTKEALAQKREQVRSAHQRIEGLLRERDTAKSEAARHAAALSQAEQAMFALQRRVDQLEVHHHHGIGAPAPIRPRTTGLSSSGSPRPADSSTAKRCAHDAQPAASQTARGSAAATTAEGQRLRRERAMLLAESGGVYTEDSPVVRDLDRRIELEDENAAKGRTH